MIDCGMYGISKGKCLARGCWWFDKAHNGPWCQTKPRLRCAVVLFVCLFVCLNSVYCCCLFVCLFVVACVSGFLFVCFCCLFVCLVGCLFVCLLLLCSLAWLSTFAHSHPPPLCDHCCCLCDHCDHCDHCCVVIIVVVFVIVIIVTAVL